MIRRFLSALAIGALVVSAACAQTTPWKVPAKQVSVTSNTLSNVGAATTVQEGLAAINTAWPTLATTGSVAVADADISAAVTAGDNATLSNAQAYAAGLVTGLSTNISTNWGRAVASGWGPQTLVSPGQTWSNYLAVGATYSTVSLGAGTNYLGSLDGGMTVDASFVSFATNTGTISRRGLYLVEAQVKVWTQETNAWVDGAIKTWTGGSGPGYIGLAGGAVYTQANTPPYGVGRGAGTDMGGVLLLAVPVSPAYVGLAVAATSNTLVVCPRFNITYLGPHYGTTP